MLHLRGDVTRIKSTRRGSTRYRAQPNNCSIMRIRGKELHCYSMYPFCSAKNCSSVSCVMFHCCDQTVLLKYLMKYGLSRCLSSKSELVNTSCFPPQVRLFCKYLAVGIVDVVALTWLVWLLPPVLQNIRSSSVGLFSDYTGLMKCSMCLIFPLLK